MFQVLRGPLTVLGRLLLCTIFFMAAVGNKIPHFRDVAKIMESVGVPAPQFMLQGGDFTDGNGRGGVSGGPMLPSVLEMTTRPSPYSTPGAYSVTSSIGSGYASPGPLLPALGYREGGRALSSVSEGGQQPPRSRSPETGCCAGGRTRRRSMPEGATRRVKGLTPEQLEI